MKKLLLLTTLPLVAFLTSFAGKEQGPSMLERSLSDTAVEKRNDTKAGFRDLFESTTNDGSLFNVQLNPKAVSFVQDYMDGHTSQLTKMKTWGRPYFDLIDKVLAQHKLPTELKYLSVIESDLKNSAVSWAGAVGPWQLMPQTARDLGLRVSRNTDERRDYAKSTHAAARYLNELYSIFNDWLLVIAAYNTGPANVLSAIRKSGSRNFWDLQYNLPAESRNHVKKFIATHYIMEGDGGVTTMTRKERTDHLLFSDTAATITPAGIQSTMISGKYTASVVAQNLGMDVASFNKLNPYFDKMLSQNGYFELRLPADKMQTFAESRNLILEQSVKSALAMATR